MANGPINIEELLEKVRFVLASGFHQAAAGLHLNILAYAQGVSDEIRLNQLEAQIKEMKNELKEEEKDLKREIAKCDPAKTHHNSPRLKVVAREAKDSQKS